MPPFLLSGKERFMSYERKREWLLPEEQGSAEAGGAMTGAAATGTAEGTGYAAGSAAACRQPVSPVIRSILAGRGVCGEEEIEEFLSPRPKMTFDPFLLKNMEGAVELILKTLDEGGKICVYGDYDADGVTSSSLMMTVLGKLTQNLTYYIPSRFDEGYGLNAEAVKSIAADGVKLLITVDCGSLSHSEVELAKELGMNVIVTDHHSIGDGKPADCLLINPKQADCAYPFKELAGCGVAFKLAQALQRRLEQRGGAAIRKADITDTLDLVAVATIGDIVPLVGENRSLVKYGLNMLNQGKRPGLRALVEGVGLTLGKIKSEQVAYIIVPHLNAAGRMISAKKGVELLLDSEQGPEADSRRREAVSFLVENNKERKRVQEKTFRECQEIAAAEQPDDLFQVIYAPEAHEGIAGIVAGKIKDSVYRPTIITTNTGDGFLKGTGRSLEGINLHQLLSAHSELFERFGGHSGACGFTMKQENLTELRRGLNEDLARALAENPQLLTEFISVEGIIEPDELTMDLIRDTEKLGPFGHRNPEPLFAVRQVQIKKVSYMGDQGQHVRFQASAGKCSFGCILFQHAADYADLLFENSVVDIAGYPGLNEWNGTTKIQFVIKDVK